ncbi:MAG: ABC transporter ATP-binding protein [Lewinellaceae bacterium]|nr:ABC transporter ATP-binding protein [Lewinellaceae bacterium]
MTTHPPALVFDNIHKSFGPVTALEGVSLEIGRGELFGLIGPDGAGKTTLMRILTTLLLPDQGAAQVLGYDVIKQWRNIRREVGYMPGRFSLYQDLSVAENLHFFATLFGTTVAENYDLIRDIYEQLEPFRKRRAGKLSGGMKQKLALCCALVHRPQILFLDEPTTGVDPVSRQEFWQILNRLQDQGITIFVSTPYMDEASLCDRVALIQDGHFLAVDKPGALAASYEHPLYAVKARDRFRLLQDVRQWPPTYQAFPFGEQLHLSTRTEIDPQQLVGYLTQQGHQEITVTPTAPTIEDRFMELMTH